MSEEQPPAPDNVRVLFPGQPTAVPVPPQPEVLAELLELIDLARAGKIIGLVWIGVDSDGRHAKATCGKVPMNVVITAMEQLKFDIMATDFALQPQRGK